MFGAFGSVWCKMALGELGVSLSWWCYAQVTEDFFKSHIFFTIIRFIESLQWPGARRARVWHHHGSDTPTSPKAILHHTDPNATNISGGSVWDKERGTCSQKSLSPRPYKKEQENLHMFILPKNGFKGLKAPQASYFWSSGTFSAPLIKYSLEWPLMQSKCYS